MSLILRKTCQPMLDDNGLGNFHVDISREKTLAIVGECGQPFVYVTGVSFHKFQPTRVEIDYAAELLDAFLVKHLSKMKRYLKKKAEFALMESPKSETKEYNIVIGGYGYKGPRITYTDSCFRVGINLKRELESIEVVSRKVMLSEVESYSFDEKKADKMVNKLSEYIEYRNTKNTLEELKSDLSKCDI